MAERKTFGQWSMNGGELSERMHGRVDQAVYPVALGSMVGWLPLLQGPALAAPGTIYVSAAADPSRMLPFEFVPTQGYAIAASSGQFQFFTNDARIETAPGVPYAVAHPYSYADVLKLDYWQSADVLYLAGGNRKPKKLSRTGAVTFALSDLELSEGPIEIGNSDETITVEVNATTGAGIAVTSSAPIFAAGDVGGLFEIVAKDFNDIPSWEPGKDNVPFGSKCQWGGRVYVMTQLSDYTGTNPPEHDEGEMWDGDGTGVDSAGHGPYGAKWLYLYNRYGLVEITGYSDSQHVFAKVIKRLADSLVTTPSWRWAFGAFSDTRGWPDTVGGWNDCLVLTKGNQGYTSVIGDFENFGRRDGSGDFQRDLSGQFILPKPAKINWQASDRYLLLGTDTDEYTVERVQIQTGTPGPPVFDIRLQSSNGSAKTKPIQADGRILFLQRAGRKLREMGYAISSDRYVAPDMTRLADHIGQPGFVELAWQAEPERLVWAVLGDGSLAAMTYDPEQQVMGWCRRYLGGQCVVKSICRITDPEGKRDQLWLNVYTPHTGSYWILRMAKAWESGDDQADAIMSDAALSYAGAAVATFSGLGHLEGQEVDILADGKPHRRLTVAGGEVTLDYAASKVHIGLPFEAYFETLPPETGQSEGTAQGKLKRVTDVTVHVVEAQGLQISVQGCDVIPIEMRTAEVPMGAAVPLFSGLIQVPTIGTYERLGTIRIERFQPTPATVVAIVPGMEVGE